MRTTTLKLEGYKNWGASNLRKEPLLQIILQYTASHLHSYNLLPISATDSMVYKALDTFSRECVTGGILVQCPMNNPLY